MTLEDFTRLLLPAVETELQTIVRQALPNENLELRHMLSYHLGWEGPGAGPEAQGKRIRPLLVLLTASSLNLPWQNALPAAAAVELIHNFSLIHDDIQDQSQLRRNRQTLWVKWGIPQAINAGDTMFTLAQLAILRGEGPSTPKTTLEASRLLNEACIDLTVGQYLDLSYESRKDLLVADYWPMVSGKTAALLSTCAALGALVAGTPVDKLQVFKDFGRYLGLAFQVQDDLLGVWGESGQTGKSTQTDLVSGKKTLPVLYGLEQNGKFAQSWANRSISGKDVPEVVNLLTSDGAYTYSQEIADHLTHLALQSLAIALPTENDASKALIELTHSLLQRTS